MNLKEAINSVKNKGEIKVLSDKERSELQNTLVEMYKDLLEVCEKYKLTPYLGGGSALGAVRHGGFIPWDDDFDVNMTREDYSVLQSVFERELSDKYILSAPNYKGKSITRFPKILKKGTKLAETIGPREDELQCVFIDIFLIENIPENRFHMLMKGTVCNTLEYIASRVNLYVNADSVSISLLKQTGCRYYLDRFVGAFFSWIPLGVWNNLVDRAVQYPKDSSLCGFPTGRKHYFGEILEKKKLFPQRYIQFGDIMVPVFSGVDYYLRNLFGDYMKIPPEEKREQHFIREMKL